MDVVALLPWWVGVALALVCYGALHIVATRPLGLPQAGQPIGSLATAAIWQGLATAGQYVLPTICLLGAIISAVRRRHRQALFESTSASNSASALHRMSWQEFEMLVGEGFRRRGFAVKEIGGGGPDGGVDLVLVKDGEQSFVQCKQWKAFKVGVSTVRELYGVMAAEGVAGGFIVTSGRFTEEAAAFSMGRNIRLIDGSALMQLLREARTGTETSSPTSDASAVHVTPVPAPAKKVDRTGTVPMKSSAMSADPDCPKCGKPMVKRVARRGAAVGKAFWGCSDYSGGCRGSRDIFDD